MNWWVRWSRYRGNKVLRVTDREKREVAVSDGFPRATVNRRTRICKQKLQRNSDQSKA